METTERVVEAYVRYVKGWFTLPNIKCDGQFEIDLLTLGNLADGKQVRYHIESGVSISGGFSRLTNKPFSPDHLKQRTKTPGQRRTLGYFVERKFGAPEVIDKLRAYGFTPGNYKKAIVSWGWDDDVVSAAGEAGVELWDFRVVLKEIAQASRHRRTYYTDDTMRTLQLMALATER